MDQHTDSMPHVGSTHSPAATLTVSQLADAADGALRRASLDDVWVVGTLVRVKSGASYTYGELVEHNSDGSPRAVLHLGIWSRNMARINRALHAAGTALRSGQRIRVRGRVDADRRYGRLRMLVDDIDPSMTLGEAAIARRALVEELHASGATVRQQYLQVPALPLRLGLVSSQSAAGRSDVFATLGRDGGVSCSVLEQHASMSGPAATTSVPAALERLARTDVQLIIVARGGGSASDLAVWDSREIATAIAVCPIPVWTALGHATDRFVADEVAHMAWDTPTAAAAAVREMHRRYHAHRDEQRVLETQRGHHEAALARQRRHTRVATVAALVALLVVAIVVLTAIAT